MEDTEQELVAELHFPIPAQIPCLQDVVELAFPVSGKSLPSDHGYAMYGALSRLVPELHSDIYLAVNTIPGMRDHRGAIRLAEGTTLNIRAGLSTIPRLLRLSGKQLDVDGFRLRLGIPSVDQLKPAETLRSRIVIIKVFDCERDPPADRFMQSAVRQLSKLGIEGRTEFFPLAPEGEQSAVARKVVTIKGRRIVGYGLKISGLSEENSIRLQIAGLGGKRKMGCGIFMPIGNQDN